MKDLSKPKSRRNIQVFIGFANVYRHFIEGFSKNATLLTLMLNLSAKNNSTNRKKSCTSEQIATSKLSYLTFKARLAFT